MTVLGNNRLAVRWWLDALNHLSSKPQNMALAIIIATSITASGSTHAKTSQEQEPEKKTPFQTQANSEWYLGIASGYGERSNPLINSSPINLYFIVDIAWYGEHWFFDNGDIGYSFVDKEAFTVNWVTRLNSERLFFQKTNTNIVTVGDVASPVFGEDDGDSASPPSAEDPAIPSNPMPAPSPSPSPSPSPGPDDENPAEIRIQVPSRRFALESGIEWMMDGKWGYAQASVFGDVSQVHKGYEVSASYGKRFHIGRWIYDASVGASWKSAQLNNYYYGVLPGEANDQLPEYRAGSGLNTFGRFLIRYPLSRQWYIALLTDIEYLNKAITQSPLVKDRDVKSTYLGIKYIF